MRIDGAAAGASRSSVGMLGGTSTGLPRTVYVAAKELARRVHAAKIADAELRDQATRAAKSTFLRLCEGRPNDGAAMRRRYFSLAHDSLHEIVGAVDLAATIGAMRQVDADAVQALAARLKPMLRGLMHSK